MASKFTWATGAWFSAQASCARAVGANRSQGNRLLRCIGPRLAVLGLLICPAVRAEAEVSGHAEVSIGTNYLWRGQPTYLPAVTPTVVYDNSLTLSGLDRFSITAGLWNAVSGNDGTSWPNPYFFADYQATEKLSLELGYQVFASAEVDPHDQQHEIWAAATYQLTEALSPSLYLGYDPVRLYGYYAKADATIEAEVWRFSLEMNPALAISRYEEDEAIQFQHLSLDTRLTYPFASVGFVGPVGQLAWSGRDDQLWGAAALVVGVSND